MRGRLRALWRRQGERVTVWVGVVGLLVGVAVLLYFGTPLHGGDESVQSVVTDDAIDVEQEGGTYVLSPAKTDSDVGLVFYPGGRVHPDAYLSSLAPLVRQENVTVAVVKMPLNLAVFDQNAATPVMDRRTEVDRWYVGGHSLGGAMACRYVRANPDRAEGLVLFASYCDKSIATTDLRVLSVTGEDDTVLDSGAYRRYRDNLPPNATHVELSGLNHSQFGSYTGQPGGTPASISYETAHERLANVTVPWFRNATRGTQSNSVVRSRQRRQRASLP